jgi:hypothetical protein
MVAHSHMAHRDRHQLQPLVHSMAHRCRVMARSRRPSTSPARSTRTQGRSCGCSCRWR